MTPLETIIFVTIGKDFDTLKKTVQNYNNDHLERTKNFEHRVMKMKSKKNYKP